MPKRALSQCRYVGCCELLEKPGFCSIHKPAQTRASFELLDKQKTERARAFYASRKWTEASIRHRKREPLCRRCRAAGKIVAAQMVHHNPPLEELIAQNLSPYASQHLESLCNNCHLYELRKKRQWAPSCG